MWVNPIVQICSVAKKCTRTLIAMVARQSTSSTKLLSQFDLCTKSTYVFASRGHDWKTRVPIELEQRAGSLGLRGEAPCAFPAAYSLLAILGNDALARYIPSKRAFFSCYSLRQIQVSSVLINMTQGPHSKTFCMRLYLIHSSRNNS